MIIPWIVLRRMLAVYVVRNERPTDRPTERAHKRAMREGGEGGEGATSGGWV